MGGPKPPGPAHRDLYLRAGPSCPACGERRIWTNWWDCVVSCPACELDLQRHGWLAAMWINTWFAVVAVVGWIVGGMVVTGGDGPTWVTAGAVMLALVTPAFTYRYAKGLMLRLLYRLDPPEAT